MLNRAKILHVLAQVTPEFFKEQARERDITKEIWEFLCRTQEVQEALILQHSHYTIPVWVGSLGDVTALNSDKKPYKVFSVDGSQIYPDRHQGIDCAVINIGTALFIYATKSSVYFDSVPTVLLREINTEELSPEFINSLRTEYEFRKAVTCAQEYPEATFLLDGSLIFWHLETKDTVIKNKFLTSYLAILDKLYELGTVHAGFISLPKSKELVNIIRRLLERTEYKEKFSCTLEEINYLCDADIAYLYLKPGERSIIFAHQSNIVDYYPDHLKPHFFYYHAGSEVVRIEIPAWIAHDAQQLNNLEAVIADQCTKGAGYPVCLAEAHEQAVIKSADRDFFYHCMQKIMIEQKQRFIISQKSNKKRIVAI